MKNFIFLIVLFFSTGSFCTSQNIVPNGAFEDTVYCPFFLGQIDATQFWFDPTITSTPDYLNSCSTYPNTAVPHSSYFGFQNPHSGNGYAGIFLYKNSIVMYREYMEVQLIEPLQEGLCYHFEMFVNGADTMKYVTDDLGVYFSDTIVSGINFSSNLLFNPQIENATGNYFDTINWKLFSGNYIAHGGENYLIIGNFKNDSNTTVLLNYPSSGMKLAYVFIDDVSLTANEPLQIDLGIDTTLCQGEQLLLNASTGFQNYLWQDSSTSESFLFNDTALGNYNLNVLVTDSGGCKASDSINVSVEICGGIESSPLEASFIVYPSPATNQLTVYSEQLSGSTIEVVDLLGRKIYEENANQKSEIINLESFADGVYFIKLQMQSGEDVVKKFIKE